MFVIRSGYSECSQAQRRRVGQAEDKTISPWTTSLINSGCMRRLLWSLGRRKRRGTFFCLSIHREIWFIFFTSSMSKCFEWSSVREKEWGGSVSSVPSGVKLLSLLLSSLLSLSRDEGCIVSKIIIRVNRWMQMTQRRMILRWQRGEEKNWLRLDEEKMKDGE